MINALKTISKQNPIDVFLVTIQQSYSATLYGEYGDEEDQESDFQIDHWVDLNDKILEVGKVLIDEDCLYPKNAFWHIAPYEERKELGDIGGNLFIYLLLSFFSGFFFFSNRLPN